ncbi:MAG: type I DNA topoisomerase, partial [Oscillospiraceae bacterium]|nr:type I DNA topoisomerase [Oscillospiraceae bacterium]
MSKLIVVESPAKAKTIKNYLGKDYVVLASMGHIRDLPKSSMGVNVNKQFQPLYLTIDGKEKIIKQLKDAAKESDEVFLATDPDREGEAISWHLAKLLNLDVDIANRVIFGEITKSGVLKGMSNPKHIDMDLVNAQQARRVLDRIVGYMLSPFLWKKVRRGLSAGRVQSVTVRLIVDREREIEAFVPEEYWHIDVLLRTDSSSLDFTARLRTKDGIPAGKFKITDKAQADEITEQLKNEQYIIKSVKESKRKRAPEPPFITSTLQQDAARKLGFTASRTMRAAQELYEGVAVEGHDTIGLITYMRTDSVRISPEAHSEALEHIEKTYGKEYVEATPRAFRTRRTVAAQEGHEAIRPTH